MENYSLAVSACSPKAATSGSKLPDAPRGFGHQQRKLPVNGGVNLSISDGWWCEGYNRQNGWTIGPVVTTELPSSEQNDYADAEALYTLLENDVLPLYFEAWPYHRPARPLDRPLKRSLKSLTPMYSTNRMLNDYLRQYYLRAARRRNMLAENDWAACRALAAWKADLATRFGTVKVEEIIVSGLENNTMLCGEPRQRAPAHARAA